MNISEIINSLSKLLDNVADHMKAYLLLVVTVLISAVIGVPLLVFYRDPDKFLLLDDNPYIGLDRNVGEVYSDNKETIAVILHKIKVQSEADRVLLYVYRDEKVYLVAEENRALFGPMDPAYYVNDVNTAGFRERLEDHYYGACAVININDVSPDSYLYSMMRDMGSLLTISCPSLESSFVIELSYSRKLDPEERTAVISKLRDSVRELENSLFVN